MLRVAFELDAVKTPQISILVRSLCALNVLYLRQHPHAPPLYATGVRYRTQPGGVERFRTIPQVLEAGEGDCDQLAPWRAAELRVRHGIKATPEVRQMGPNLWHVYVRLPNGRVEDVSAHLGMRVPQNLVRLGREIMARNRSRRK